MLEEKPKSLAPSDEELLWASLRRPELFKVIVERYESAFLRRAKRWLGNREEANDVVVETFSKIYFKAKSFKPIAGATFRSWAYQILRRSAYSALRDIRKREGREVSGDQEIFATLADPAVLGEGLYGIKTVVSKIINLLPESFSRILSLRFIEDKTLLDIARAEQITISLTKVRLHRAKKEFKNLWKLYGEI